MLIGDNGSGLRGRPVKYKTPEERKKARAAAQRARRRADKIRGPS
jgi:hypothetical protein